MQNKYQFENGKNVNILRRREQHFDEVLSSAVSQHPSKKVLTRATDNEKIQAGFELEQI